MGMGGAPSRRRVVCSMQWMYVCVCARVCSLREHFYLFYLIESSKCEICERPLKLNSSWNASVHASSSHDSVSMDREILFFSDVNVTGMNASTLNLGFIKCDCFYPFLLNISSFRPTNTQDIDLNVYARKTSNQSLLCVNVAGWELEVNAFLDAGAQLHRSITECRKSEWV